MYGSGFIRFDIFANLQRKKEVDELIIINELPSRRRIRVKTIFGDELGYGNKFASLSRE